MNLKEMRPWEKLQKEMIWRQLNFVENKTVLDFGSGYGYTANHLAKKNKVIAIEPSEEMIHNRVIENTYTQIKGSINELKRFEDSSFDIIICHNVLEYAENRKSIINEFARILKDDGILSIVKHNRYGRVMQMVVLLNNFEHANELLDGECGYAQDFGKISYYSDDDITKWAEIFSIRETHGIRTFWDLQQNQDIQKEQQWQENMLLIEEKVSDMKEFYSISSFHHVIYIKRK